MSISSSGTKSSILATAPLPPVALVTLDGVSEMQPTTATNHKLLPYKENENPISFHIQHDKPDTQRITFTEEAIKVQPINTDSCAIKVQPINTDTGTAG